MNRVDRRIPIDRMIYTADGPSDVPVFSVVKSNGGKAYAVFNPESEAEFAQRRLRCFRWRFTEMHERKGERQ